jgi:hypothetical protein
MPASAIRSIINAFDTIPVAKVALHMAEHAEYRIIMYCPIFCSDTPSTFPETYFEIDVTSGNPILAARAVLLGITGAARNSVKITLYDIPFKFFPNIFINRYAILNPNDDLVITLDIERTQNNSHGTVFENPVKLDLTSIVDVKFAKIIPINRTVKESQTSTIIPVIIATNIMATRYPTASRPAGGSTNFQQTHAAHNMTTNGPHLIFVQLSVSLKN